MVGAEESLSQCGKTCCQVACGMLGFVCISECFVCKSRTLIYLQECVGGREAAEKHPELYENPGISTSGNRIAAYQTHTHTPLCTPPCLSLFLTPLDSLLNTRSNHHTLILTHTWQPRSIHKEPKGQGGLNTPA